MSHVRPRPTLRPGIPAIATRLRGIAFPVGELAILRHWAASRGFSMSIQLDRVVDGAADEEVVWLVPAQGERAAISLWRTASGVIAQRPQAAPVFHAELPRALASLLRGKRRFWLPRLFA